MNGLTSYILSKKYVDDSLQGAGALKGKDGKDGKSAYEIAKDNGFTGTEVEWLESLNGTDGKDFKYSDFTPEQLDSLKVKGDDGVSPTITENADNTDKIYKLDIETADGKFTTPNLRGADGQGGSSSGEENKIEVIKVNGVEQTISADKSVDITVPSTEGLASETWVNEQGFLTEHQDISGKVDKVDGKSLISDTEIARLATVDNYDDTDIKAEIAKKADATAIPSKVSELTNDSNYQTAEQVNSTVTTEIAKIVADAPESLNTLKEMSDWIAGHEDDASAMNSAISDNKTAIASLQTGKADKSDIPTTVAELSDSADYAKKTDLHSHENKTVLDGITSTKVSDWDSAKTHADSAHAPSNAQENVLETVKVNGTALEVSNKAVNVTVPTTVAQLTDSADYAKTADIPTTLPANGGNADTVNNHTVETNVPENAKFTDTIYDDTEVKGSIKELSSNLDTLEFGEVAGGKNLVYKTIKNANIETNGTIIATTDATDIHVAKVESGKTYTFTADSTVYAFYSVEPKLTIQSYDSSRVTSGSRTITIPSGVSYLAFRTLNTYTTVMVEEGSTATTYEPYIPSVKMLADKIYNNTKVDIVLYNEFDTKADNIQNSLYLLGDILFGSLYFRFDEEHDPFTQGFDWVAIADVPQITSTRTFYNCISYAELLDDNDYAKGDVRIWEGKLQIRIRKQPTVSRLNWYIFCNSICEKVELAK